MKIKTEQFAQAAVRELNDEQSRSLLERMSSIVPAMREGAMASFPDPQAALELGRAIRAETIARMPELLEEFERNAVENGARVFWARDAREANEFVLNIAKERNIKYVTKGKSMVTEEIGLNEVLIRNGVEVFEADLGEFIIQLLERPPFHITGPGINIAVEEIAKIFMEKAGMEEYTTDPVELGAAARRFLRDKFHHLEMGITGVNMAIAENGAILNVENEGNIRLTKSAPKTQVSVMTIEKVVPTIRDALHLLRLLCRNCTAQKISSYVSMDFGPKRQEEIDGPEELFIVIVDNGRCDFYGDPQAREALRCIRCGACMFSCPIYMKIGGYPYGWAYSGPMGQALNPLLLGLDKTEDLFHACTLCGKCKEVCPSGIDHPKMLLTHRARDVEFDRQYSAKGRPWTETRFMDMFTLATLKSWIWNLGAKIFRPFANRNVEGGAIRKMNSRVEGWFKSRDLPPLAEKTFHKRAGEIEAGKEEKK